MQTVHLTIYLGYLWSLLWTFVNLQFCFWNISLLCCPPGLFASCCIFLTLFIFPYPTPTQRPALYFLTYTIPNPTVVFWWEITSSESLSFSLPLQHRAASLPMSFCHLASVIALSTVWCNCFFNIFRSLTSIFFKGRGHIWLEAVSLASNIEQGLS